MKPNIFMRIAAVLLCLTLLSTCLLSGMLARYTTVGTGSDEARVAKFGTLTLTESKTQFQLVPGVPAAKDPRITMTASEVSVRVLVELTLKDNVWTFDETTKTFTYGTFLSFAIDSDWTFLETKGSTYIFYRDLAPNAELDEDSVLQGNQIMVSEVISYEDYYNLDPSVLDITIRARAMQID